MKISEIQEKILILTNEIALLEYQKIYLEEEIDKVLMIEYEDFKEKIVIIKNEINDRIQKDIKKPSIYDKKNYSSFEPFEFTFKDLGYDKWKQMYLHQFLDREIDINIDDNIEELDTSMFITRDEIVDKRNKE